MKLFWFTHSFRLLFLILALVAPHLATATDIGGISYSFHIEGYGDNAVATYAIVSGPAAGFTGIANIETQASTIYQYTKRDEFGNVITDEQGNAIVFTRLLSAPVTTISKDAFKSSSVVSVTIPSSITTIGDNAFAYCTKLTNINIQHSVIGKYMFTGCTALSIVNIANSVTSIGPGAFSNCTGLTSANIQNSVIGSNMFYGCTSLIDVTISNSVTSIAESAFCGCSALPEITIPNSVTSIAESAFWGCSALSEITIPNSVTSIGDYAFNGCRNLTNITVPSSVKNLGTRAFYGAGLIYASIDSENIGYTAFLSCASLETLIIGNAVKNIGEEAFRGCSNLKKIFMGNSIATIGRNAFLNDMNVAEVHISDLASWYNISYNNCYSTPFGETNSTKRDGLFLNGNLIKEIIIPDTMTHIKDCVFDRVNISRLIIPASVTSIGAESFYQCFYKDIDNNQPTSITCFAKEPPIIGNLLAFESYSGQTSRIYKKTILRVPKGTIEAYKSANEWKYFQNIEEFEVDFKPGDVNNDGKTDISDVITLISFLLSGHTDGDIELNLDVNNDGKINISDVTELINLLLNGN